MDPEIAKVLRPKPKPNPAVGGSLEHQMMMRKYGDLKPKKPLRDLERKHFDSADWQMAKEKGDVAEKVEEEHLAPKLQPSPPKRVGRRPSFAEQAEELENTDAKPAVVEGVVSHPQE
eukprot:jgi/Mesvir1/27327/Mv26380-RA.1